LFSASGHVPGSLYMSYQVKIEKVTNEQVLERIRETRDADTSK
jgi:hypothetical protein